MIRNHEMHQLAREDQQGSRLEGRIGRRGHPETLLLAAARQSRIDEAELAGERIVRVLVPFGQAIDETRLAASVAVRHHEIALAIDVAPAVIDICLFGIEQLAIERQRTGMNQVCRWIAPFRNVVELHAANAARHRRLFRALFFFPLDELADQDVVVGFGVIEDGGIDIVGELADLLSLGPYVELSGTYPDLLIIKHTVSTCFTFS